MHCYHTKPTSVHRQARPSEKPKGLFTILPHKTASLLRELIRLDQSDYTIHDRPYLLCKTKFLEDSTECWSPQDQKRQLRNLRLRGFISIRRKRAKRDAHCSRWVRINYDTLEQVLGHNDFGCDIHKYTNQQSPKGQYDPIINTSEDRSIITMSGCETQPDEVVGCTPIPSKESEASARAGAGFARSGDGASPIPKGSTHHPRKKEGSPPPTQAASPPSSPETKMLGLDEELGIVDPSDKLFPPVTSEINGFAVLLVGAVRKYKALGIRRKRTAQFLARLLRKLGGETARLSSVLKWYCEVGIALPKAHEAWCGEAFNNKFLAIEASHQRWLKKNPQLSISTDAKQIHAHLVAHDTWPNEDELATAVQSSLNGLNELNAKLNAICDANGSGSRKPNSGDGFIAYKHKNALGELAFHMLRAGPTRMPDHTAQVWFEKLSDYLHKFPERGGNLLKLGISLDNPRFLTHCRQVILEYCHNEESWEKLLKEIKS